MLSCICIKKKGKQSIVFCLLLFACCSHLGEIKYSVSKYVWKTNCTQKKSKPFSGTSGFTIQKRIRQALGNSWKEYFSSYMEKMTLKYLRNCIVQEPLLHQLFISN